LLFLRLVFSPYQIEIASLCQHIEIKPNMAEGALATLLNKSILDIEDGLEYYAADAVSCKCIITEDIEDFHFSDIEILSCEEFFKKHLHLEKG